MPTQTASLLQEAYSMLARFFCAYCQLEYEEYRNQCFCGKKHSIIAYPVPQNSQNKRIKSANELLREKHNVKEIPGFEYLGFLPKEWAMLISGPPGQGKSTLAIRIAQAIARDLGDRAILYWSFEEKHSEKLIRKLRLNNIKADNLFFVNTDDPYEFIKDLKMKNPCAFIVDSITDIGMDQYDIKKLRQLTNCPAIYIAHFTKGGIYKGNSDIEHEIDIYIEVKKFRGKIVKNRLGGEIDEEMIVPVLDGMSMDETIEDKEEDEENEYFAR